MLRQGDSDLHLLRERLIRVAAVVRDTVSEKRQMVLSLIIGRLIDCLHFIEITLKRCVTEGETSLVRAYKTRSFLNYLRPEEALHVDPQVQAILDEAQAAHRQLRFENAAGKLFQTAFRDKRELEDLVRHITQVRNDLAHFRRVPQHELDKGRVAAGELLRRLEKPLSERTFGSAS